VNHVCPKCGGSMRIVIDLESRTHLEPPATLACVGDGARSCGWVLGYWRHEWEIRVIANLMTKGKAA
jgi:hypothetical protein